MLAEQAGRRRRRLSPDQRIKEILDAAYALVLQDGMSTLTMDKIARQADASKALLYSYFTNMTDLLQALYEREHDKLQALHLAALNTPHGFEEMVKLTAKINRENQNDRLLLLKRLEADVSVRKAMAKTDQQGRSDVVKFLSKEITAHFDVPKDIAADAVRLALRFQEQDRLHSVDDHIKQDEIWGAMMVGAMQELEKRFGKNRR
ncbi:MAG: TetR/AcrR family transcriptional regulator [Gammaproteobacteria bacterium]|jgi:TetR/AcrR family transcriptional regulator, fatty acid biosynthesis regulator|nr:TetR/AcrR family transcriptional regulator [Gammaproteobacteria bacterium]MBT5204938.1 TetR/AcrR family transcriptional regulator [Gammaproteobacteria bacterium]MBT5600898.1 TetR/AcrR family transcriptional regulator [Gammaproteobacteria bacterium]MBT6247112.1 TetR/AcrR family transcriptional regulator [Gammaproteobacteria bacterium]